MAPTVGYSSVEKNVLIKAAFITVFVILLHFDLLPLFFKKLKIFPYLKKTVRDRERGKEDRRVKVGEGKKDKRGERKEEASI